MHFAVAIPHLTDQAVDMGHHSSPRASTSRNPTRDIHKHCSETTNEKSRNKSPKHKHSPQLYNPEQPSSPRPERVPENDASVKEREQHQEHEHKERREHKERKNHKHHQKSRSRSHSRSKSRSNSRDKKRDISPPSWRHETGNDMFLHSTFHRTKLEIPSFE